MSKYPAIPNSQTIVSILKDPNVDDMIGSLKRILVNTYDVKPVKPSRITEHTPAAMRAHADALEAYESEILEYSVWKNEASAFNFAVERAIERWVKTEAGLYRIPEQYRDKVWSKAWADGHSSGYHEVLNCLRELVDIFA